MKTDHLTENITIKHKFFKVVVFNLHTFFDNKNYSARIAKKGATMLLALMISLLVIDELAK